jgi:hypothetical protein
MTIYEQHACTTICFGASLFIELFNPEDTNFAIGPPLL